MVLHREQLLRRIEGHLPGRLRGGVLPIHRAVHPSPDEAGDLSRPAAEGLRGIRAGRHGDRRGGPGARACGALAGDEAKATASLLPDGRASAGDPRERHPRCQRRSGGDDPPQAVRELFRETGTEDGQRRVRGRCVQAGTPLEQVGLASRVLHRTRDRQGRPGGARRSKGRRRKPVHLHD